MARRRPWDAIVVGGGVVGCAVLRELTVNLGWRVLLVEASPHLAAGASSGNTGIACTASDVAPGTLEHACLLEGTRLNLPTYRALNVPHRASGSMYVGHSEADLAALSLEQAARQQRGDHTTAMLSAAEARSREPGLSAAAAGALYVPSEVVVDPWLVPLAYARHAHENGATIRRGTEVTAAAWADGKGGKDGCWQLQLSPSGAPGGDGSRAGSAEPPEEPSVEEARLVVACGGLRGDELESLHRAPPFAIRPRRGDYVLFDETAALGNTPIGQVAARRLTRTLTPNPNP